MKVFAEGEQPQPNEIQRPICSSCGSFMRHKASISMCEINAGYAVLNCIVCGFTQLIACVQTAQTFGSFFS
jgi:RNase P subunit RPR2